MCDNLFVLLYYYHIIMQHFRSPEGRLKIILQEYFKENILFLYSLPSVNQQTTVHAVYISR